MKSENLTLWIYRYDIQSTQQTQNMCRTFFDIEPAFGRRFIYLFFFAGILTGHAIHVRQVK